MSLSNKGLTFLQANPHINEAERQQQSDEHQKGCRMHAARLHDGISRQ